ncbi:ABC transporter ATP-binding protein [Curtobacterium sp. AB7]|uniref:ABC transporter ATP-binding protein n=1 Tax=Curtobacterium sp. AB7 TaxID=3349327 RepID=UPI003837D1FA
MIRVEDVSHSYDRRQPIINHISTSFNIGEMVALTGPSGRGKSTLLFIIGLLLKPTNGTLLVAGRDTARISDRQRSMMRAEAFGYLFQDAALDPSRTVLANVTEPALYAQATRRKQLRSDALDLLGSLGVDQRADALPRQISGGQAQRIALVRALILRPPIIVADEPTASLDSESAAAVVDTLNAYSRAGNTVIVATHDQRVIRASTREVRL